MIDEPIGRQGVCVGGLRWCTTSKGENFLPCPSRAEGSRVSLCEKCRLTLHTSRLTLLPFSAALSADFASATLNRHDAVRSSSARSVVGCDGAPFLCRYLVEGFGVGAPSYTFKQHFIDIWSREDLWKVGGVCCSESVWKI